MLNIGIAGAAGKMGRALIQAVAEAEGMAGGAAKGWPHHTSRARTAGRQGAAQQKKAPAPKCRGLNPPLKGWRRQAVQVKRHLLGSQCMRKARSFVKFLLQCSTATRSKR